MEIYFYLSATKDEPPLPESIDEFSTDFRKSKVGEYEWIMQTYLWLKEFNFPCRLLREIPEQGIIIAHREGLPYAYRPNPHQLIVSIKADSNPNPFAQVHVVQNPKELILPATYTEPHKIYRYLSPGKRFFIPLWPQPGLIPRDPKRGDKFCKVAYFGISANLDPALVNESWRRELNALGLEWITNLRSNQWTDYSDIDAVVAVRQFNPSTDYSWKPATKLYNAWRAGVPALLGAESAYQAERKSELDYIEVRSVDELLTALKRLKKNPDLRQSIVENHRQRAQEVTPENIVKRWQSLIQDVCIPTYEQWQGKTPVQRQVFYFRRSWALKVCTVKGKLRNRIVN